MGVDFADYGNDGRPDIVITDLSNESYVLFRNAGQGNFDDESSDSGIALITRLQSGWGIRFLDYDNDGWKDLFVAQGHVLDNVEKTSGNLKYEQPPLLLHNGHGRFTQITGVGSVLDIPRAGRGLAIGDIDNDGYLDVVICNLGQKPSLLRNCTPRRNHWLGLRLQGTLSNRDGIGARIEITSASGIKQFYTVTTSSSYASASDRRVIAGLGSEAAAKQVVIRWPSGVVQTLINVQGDRMLDVREPQP